jgi:uncharacterized protein YlxP (DUF503 family)
MSDVELQELDIMIQALESNLMVFKMIQKKLNTKEKREVLYPIMMELRTLCDVCIPAFKPTEKLS